MRKLNPVTWALLLLFVFLPLFGQEEASGPPSVTIQMAVIAGLSILPFAVMLFTSYLKMIVVLSLLRNALGIQQTPPNQVLNGIAIILTIYVMFPTGLAMYEAAEPTINKNAPTELISADAAGYVVDVLDKAKEPLRKFMEANSSNQHMNSFYKMAYNIFPAPYKSSLKPNNFIVLLPSFITSQLKGAFEIAVMIYLPFFVIDLVTSNILLAMGMMMLSPLTIALPIKLLLLVMIDGWTVLMQGLVMTFR